jgi:hypothetical protein
MRLDSRSASTFQSVAVETSPPYHQGVAVRGGEEVRRDGLVDEEAVACSRRRKPWRKRMRIGY